MHLKNSISSPYWTLKSEAGRQTQSLIKLGFYHSTGSCCSQLKWSVCQLLELEITLLLSIPTNLHALRILSMAFLVPEVF